MPLAVIYGFLVFHAFQPTSPAWFRIAAIAFATSMAMRRLWDWRQRQRKLKDLIAADWRRCPRCFFDLTGLGEQGTCPECGEQFVTDEVRERWKVAMAAEQEAASRED